ncbi:MAG: type II toxin-antitoxin system PemK/MazF family toxin [Clostridia bacterium]|nr:type II toxin-antitoxin system PemK/MazF family toxin [Clostridia bacterium]
MECDNMKRGEIYRADLDPVVGSEQGGIRPVVIIQNDIGNQHSTTVIVAAVTTRSKKANLPVHVAITAAESGLERDSVVLLEQLRTLEKSRLTKYLGCLTGEAMRRIDKALALSLGTA